MTAEEARFRTIVDTLLSRAADGADVSGKIGEYVALIHEFARIAAAGDTLFSADDAAPGTVRVTIENDWLRVPFPLVPDLPQTTLLREAVKAAQPLRLKQSSVLCLSGSVLYQGSVHFLGDLDVCEYLDETPEDAEFHRFIRSSADLPMCLTIKFRATNVRHDHPFSPPPTALARTFGEAGGAKLDFLSNIELRPIEATNVCFDRGKSASFVFQEAPIKPAMTPRHLHETTELIEYAAFLARDVNKYAGVRPIKCLKRCLALARITGRWTIADRIRTLLNGCPLLPLEAAVARQDLHDRLEILSGKASASHLAALRFEIRLLAGAVERMRKTARPEQDDEDRFNEAVVDIVASMFEDLPLSFLEWAVPDVA